MRDLFEELNLTSDDIMDNLTEGILVLDEEGVILYASETMMDMLGYSVDEMVGEKCFSFMDEEGDWALEEFVSRIDDVSEHQELEFTRKDGSTMYALVSGTPLTDDGDTRYVIATVNDVTERKKLREELEHINSVLRAVQAVNQLIVRERKSENLLERVCQLLTETRSYYNAWITRLDDELEPVDFYEAGLGSELDEIIECVDENQLPLCIKRCLDEPGIHLIEDPANTCADCHLAENYGDRSSIFSSISYHGKTYGVLVISSPKGLRQEEERSLLKEVTTDIAYVLHLLEVEEEREEYFWRLRERNKELKTLYGLSNIATSHGFDFEEICEDFVDLLPQGYQFPDVACARLTFDDEVYESEEFSESEWIQSTDVIVEGESRGSIQVYYIEERPYFDEGPFLSQERELLEELSKQLSDIYMRTQAEEELEFRSMLLDSATDSIFVHDLDGKIIYVNETAYKERGYTSEELLDMKVQDLDTPEYASLIKPRIEKLVEEGRIMFKAAHICKDGSTLPVEIHSRIIERDDERLILTVARDIRERKEAEEALRESRNRFQALFDNTPAMVYLLDDNGVFVEANEHLAERLGVSKEEIKSKRLKDLFPDEQAGKFLEDAMDVIQTGKPKREIIEPYDTPEGRRWATTDLIPFKDETGENLVLGFSRDITRLKETEDRLKALHRYASLLSSAETMDEIATYTLDALESTFDYHGIDFAKAENNVLKLVETRERAEEPIRTEIPFNGEGLVAKAARTRSSIMVADVRKSDDYFGVRDGTLSELVVPAKIEGETAAIINIEAEDPEAFTDQDRQLVETLSTHVSSAIARVRREEELEEIVEKRTKELRESEKRFREIAENSFDIIATIDPEGVITYISPSVKDILGDEPEDVIGSHYYNFLPDSFTDEEISQIKEKVESIQDGGRIKGLQLELVDSHGSTVIVEINSTPIMEEGEMVEVEAIVRDITERVRTRRRLEEQNRQLRKLDEMKDQFIAMATHELKTPLTSIKGYVDYIQSGSAGKVPERIKELLDVIQRNTRRLDTLTNDLLDQQRLESGEMDVEKEHIDLTALVEEVAEESEPMFEDKRQRLELSIPDEMPKVEADRSRISQVLINLLSNASRFSPEDSKVKLKVTEKEASVMVSVEDEGIGLSEEDMGKLFKPFPQIERPTITEKSSGLGLSISKGIVDLHGGQIWAESEGRGEGSTFVVTLPKRNENENA